MLSETDKYQMMLAAGSSDPGTHRKAFMRAILEVHAELQAIREATETEAVEDAEDPFQTLNGPSKDQNPLRYGVKGEYGE